MATTTEAKASKATRTRGTAAHRPACDGCLGTWELGPNDQPSDADRAYWAACNTDDHTDEASPAELLARASGTTTRRRPGRRRTAPTRRRLGAGNGAGLGVVDTPRPAMPPSVPEEDIYHDAMRRFRLQPLMLLINTRGVETMPKTASKKPTSNGRARPGTQDPITATGLRIVARAGIRVEPHPPDKALDPEGYAAWFIAEAAAPMPLEELKDRLFLTNRHCPDPLESDDFVASAGGARRAHAKRTGTSPGPANLPRSWSAIARRGRVSRIGLTLDDAGGRGPRVAGRGGASRRAPARAGRGAPGHLGVPGPAGGRPAAWPGPTR